MINEVVTVLERPPWLKLLWGIMLILTAVGCAMTLVIGTGTLLLFVHGPFIDRPFLITERLFALYCTAIMYTCTWLSVEMMREQIADPLYKDC